MRNDIEQIRLSCDIDLFLCFMVVIYELLGQG
jgi:hypothetical protein